MERFKEKTNNARQIIVLGSGFTAIEMAGQLALETGKEVHLIFRSENCLYCAFSLEFATTANQKLADAGVILHSKSLTKEIVCAKHKRKVIPELGNIVEGDMIIAALVFAHTGRITVFCHSNTMTLFFYQEQYTVIIT